jgi:hypothetical protein
MIAIVFCRFVQLFELPAVVQKREMSERSSRVRIGNGWGIFRSQLRRFSRNPTS